MGNRLASNLRKSVLAAWMIFGAAPMAFAQSAFETAIRVDDAVITNFEINQRVLMLQAFGSSGDLQEVAIDGLIDDRLRASAAASLGIPVDELAVSEGMEEFALRGGLNSEQLMQYLAQRGVAPETFRDFVQAGVLYREVVQTRFGPSSIVSENEIDRRLTLGQENALEIRVAELIIPNAERGDARTLALAEELSSSIRSNGAFTAAARRYSRSPSARQGGVLDWRGVDSLPGQIVSQVLALEPGEVTAPISLQGSVALFQLRGTRESQNNELPLIGMSFVTVPLPLGDDQDRLAASILRDVDTCADLRAVSERIGPDAYIDNDIAPEQTPVDVLGALSELDRFEATVAFVNGQRSIIMLCERLRELPEEGRENLRDALFNQRISGFGDAYLKELRNKATIIR